MIASCTIIGSSDSSIKEVKVNNIQSILKQTKIKKIYTNGKKAHQLYQKYIKNKVQIEDICLPSTSPANAQYKYDDLIKEYQIIKD